MNSSQNPRHAAAMLFRVVAANGRCDVRPIQQVPKSAQEIELERYLRDIYAPPAAAQRPSTVRA
ncbi:hypothetical protein [Azospirillum canadense]|uniref:hypothetical protein n=1 Tax=Azospirillum canadense TaxID=403962 RepID=UPI002226AB8F|nr:hypothetical protein [Azospirillum canadense]MCW2241021.1 hypothetical protein [Azospirillum canadense]